MTLTEVDISADEIVQSQRPEIVSVLRRISVGDGGGQWPEPADSIVVQRRLAGGGSGAEVLEVMVERRGQSVRRVVKLGRWPEMVAEWNAYREYFREPNVLCAPIEAVTDGLLHEPAQSTNEREAVVYNHVAQYAGEPDTPSETLQDLIRRACAGHDSDADTDTVVTVIGKLFRKADTLIYRRKPPRVDSAARSLSRLNSWLGPDLVIEVDREREGRLQHGEPLPSVLQSSLRYPGDVLAASTRVEPQDENVVRPGSMIHLTHLRAVWGDDMLIGKQDEIAVQIKLAEDSAPDLRLSAFAGAEEMEVFGRVVAVRAGTSWERITRVCPDLARGRGLVSAHGVDVRDPFAALHDVLTKHLPGRVFTVVHGDLNPRNVMIVDGQPYLIDYAFAARGEPILRDFAWLELFVLRDILAANLTWPELVQLQRLLGLACRALSHPARTTTPTDDGIAHHCCDLLREQRPAVGSAFRVLWAIRQSAWSTYPRGAGQPWWHEYLALLTLAAHRTLQWSDENQSVAAAQAVVSVAGVAAELLVDMWPFGQWPAEQLVAVAKDLMPHLPVTSAAGLVGELAAEIDRRAVGADPDLDAALRAARERAVRSNFRDAASQKLADLQPEHEVYIPLEAYGNPPAGFRTSPGDPAQRHPPGEPRWDASAFPILWAPFAAPPGVFPSADLSGGFGDPFPWQSPGRMFGDGEPPPTPPSSLLGPRVDYGLPFRGPLWGPRSLLGPRVAYGLPFRGALWGPTLARRSGDAIDLLAAETTAVLLGDAGAGKSTVVRELGYRLAKSVVLATEGVDTGQGGLSPRMPVIVRASDIAGSLPNTDAAQPHYNLETTLRQVVDVNVEPGLLALGAVHVTVDGFNELASSDKRTVAEWIVDMNREYPRVPIVVCHRYFDYDPALLPFPSVILQRATVDQAGTFLSAWFRARGLHDYESRAATLVRILDLPDNNRIREIAQTPLFLWMIAVHFDHTETVPNSLDQLFETFSRWYLEERHHYDSDQPPPLRHTFDEKAPVLELIADVLVQRRVTEVDEAEVAQILAELGPASVWQPVMDEIVASQMLVRAGSHLRFLHQSFQEYFAARVLAREVVADRGLLRSRVLSFAWLEPCRILLTFAGDSSDLTQDIIEIALSADPLLSETLLRAAENPPAAAVERFLAAQERSLRDPQAGEVSQHNAADALANYGTNPAWQILRDLAVDPAAPLPSRVESVRALANVHNLIRFERQQEVIEGHLVAIVKAVLGSADAPEMTEKALFAVAQAGLRSLGPLVTELVATDQPWSSVAAAGRALRDLGMELTPRMRSVYLPGAEARLAELERQLPTTSLQADWEELTNERRHLLSEVAEPSRLPLLMERRFSYGIAHDVEALVENMDLSGEPPSGYRTEWQILVQDATTDDDCLAAFAHGRPNEAVAAAHRLLRGAPARAVEMVGAVSASAPSAVLLAAAAAVEPAGEDGVSSADDLIRKLILAASPDLMEPLAALVEAVEAVDPRRAQRLSLLASSEFVHREVPSAYFWPWLAHWTKLSLPNDAEVEELLLSDEEGVRLAIFSLSSDAFTRTATRPLLGRLDSAAADRLMQAQPTEISSDAARRFVRAAASVGEFRALPYACEVAGVPAHLKLRSISNARAGGCLEEAAVGAVLGSLGYLARVAHEHDSTAAADAHALLQDFPVSEHHPSVSTGRLVGLGFLGDWESVLRGLRPDDPVLHVAAANVVSNWVPGPYTPSGGARPKDIARWIACRLASSSGLDASARATLAAIKAQLETTLGEFVTPES